MKNKRNKVWNMVTIIIALFLVYGGVQHFIKPTFYEPFVPDFLIYKLAIIYISGIGIVITGLLMLIPKYKGIGVLIFLILMLSFLPIHVWDVFSNTPAIGSHNAALIRLPIQVILILVSWKLKNIYFKRQ